MKYVINYNSNYCGYGGEQLERLYEIEKQYDIRNSYSTEYDSTAMGNEQNPPETLQSLLKWGYEFDQAQKFLARVGKNFRWPSSMPEYLRQSAFENIADVDFEFDDEVGFNLIFFYKALDKGEFAEHENEWVTVHKQRVIEYGQRYDDEKLDETLEIMPGAIQLPVKQKYLPRNPPAKMVIVQRTGNGDDYKVRVRVKRPNENLIAQLEYDFYDIQNNGKMYSCVIDTGAPQTILPYYIKKTLGGGKGWSTIVAKAEVWEKTPNDQVQCALIGNDVTDKLAYVHEPRQPIKFLNHHDELNLAQFVRGCA
ncbi:hypothetical protein Glove_120g172 [Diversispora epigaea]|uniref:Peptidase A2 domain-containing protein n=1 Tax=Diversispora epigaea TaxID=1348612 RepID=A0A397IZN5_9GLOM|nr:hypothetical protein Glove_120g172 [Diversispora epigaea]